MWSVKNTQVISMYFTSSFQYLWPEFLDKILQNHNQYRSNQRADFLQSSGYLTKENTVIFHNFRTKNCKSVVLRNLFQISLRNQSRSIQLPSKPEIFKHFLYCAQHLNKLTNLLVNRNSSHVPRKNCLPHKSH